VNESTFVDNEAVSCIILEVVASQYHR